VALKRATKAWPGIGKSRSGAPRGAPPRSQEEAARFASVLGDLASHPGASQAPAFPGAPLPLLEALMKKAQPARQDKRAMTHGWLRFAC